MIEIDGHILVILAFVMTTAVIIGVCGVLDYLNDILKELRHMKDGKK